MFVGIVLFKEFRPEMNDDLSFLMFVYFFFPTLHSFLFTLLCLVSSSYFFLFLYCLLLFLFPKTYGFFYISLQVLFTFTICTSLSYSQSLYLTSFLNFSLTFSLFRRYISLTIVCVFCLFAIIVIIISLLFMKNWVSIVSKNRFVFFIFPNKWMKWRSHGPIVFYSLHTHTHTHTEQRTKMIL